MTKISEETQLKKARFLEELELELKNRYTDLDDDYMATFNQEKVNPPILKVQNLNRRPYKEYPNVQRYHNNRRDNNRRNYNNYHRNNNHNNNQFDNNSYNNNNNYNNNGNEDGNNRYHYTNRNHQPYNR